MVQSRVRRAFDDARWFNETGVYAVFDGQFGSTGKGVLAGVMAEVAGPRLHTVTTNQGPNSGHTAWFDILGIRREIVLHQIPVAAVIQKQMGLSPITYLNAGALVDFDILNKESSKWGIIPRVHPHAAVIYPWHKGKNEHVASIGTGAGPALVDKLERHADQRVVRWREMQPYDRHITSTMNWLECGVTIMEIPQGWALGINSGVYPYTTSRECSPSQGLSDFGAPPRAMRKSIACLRTYPIRTGNLGSNSSGPGWRGQAELGWRDLGLVPEISTTAGRKRRIFEWSWDQYHDMLKACAPDALFLNFCNYAKFDVDEHVECMVRGYNRCLGGQPDFVLTGWGPEPEDVEVTWHK